MDQATLPLIGRVHTGLYLQGAGRRRTDHILLDHSIHVLLVHPALEYSDMAPMAKNCEECQNEDDLWLCTRCDEYYCSAHWSARRKHNEISSVNLHEKVRPDVKERLDDCMMSDESDEAQLVRHRDDEPSTWFAFDRDEHGNPFLAEYERFSALMMETANESGSPRYPALVSFIGQTGMTVL